MEQNLNLYQIFYEVANCHNFSVAAKKLYISQPAISKSISRLEESLHTTLFHRSSRGVRLTAEGELLFKHVENALLSLQAGEDLLKSANSQRISHLSIGVSSTLCKYLLLPHLKNFISENRNIKLTIFCQSTFETLSQLKNGAISIGLVGIPPEMLEGSAERQAVACLPLKTIEDIFVATDSCLAPFLHRHKAKPYNRDSFFKDATFIMLDKNNISRKHADSFLDSHQMILRNMIEVNNMELSIEFAKAGLGIACVIRDFVKDDIKNGTLRELKLRHKVPKRRIGFAYPAKIQMPDAMNTLIQYYQSVV